MRPTVSPAVKCLSICRQNSAGRRCMFAWNVVIAIASSASMTRVECGG